MGDILVSACVCVGVGVGVGGGVGVCVCGWGCVGVWVFEISSLNFMYGFLMEK